jgi:D-glycero-D-manno-heptose 1,7-bisphosphate phosphatase
MTHPNTTKPAVFLDRDGTLIREVDHLSDTAGLEVFSYSQEALELLKAAGFRLIVVTNQSGIGRKYFSEGSMHEIHREIQRQVGGLIDKFYFCPHLPDDECRCRKPEIGMIEDACKDFAIDLSNSWMIGDKEIDIEFAKYAGIQSILVRTGYGYLAKLSPENQPDALVDDLLVAVKHIIAKY